MRKKRLLIMAGGTGGHIMPGLAVAHYAKQQLGFDIAWLGTANGMEAKLVRQANIPLFFIAIGRLRGQSLKQRMRLPLQLVTSLYQAFRAFRQFKPDVVLSLGGFVSGPGGIMAWLLRKPLVVHEQNAVMGLTNRWLHRFATRTLSAFPIAVSSHVLGNPVDEAIEQLKTHHSACHEQPLRLLVLGGSLGAMAINQLVPDAVQLLPLDQRPMIWHQAGRQHHEAVQQAYIEKAIPACVDPFIEAMADAYAWADLVIARAGALTVSEISAAGVASILIPYPHAVDDHQTKNAGYLADANAALVILQKDCHSEHLAALLTRFFRDRTQLDTMGRQAARLHPASATRAVATHCLEV